MTINFSLAVLQAPTICLLFHSLLKTGTSALLGQMTVMVLQCVTTHMAASDARANQDTSTMDPTALVCNRTCLKASQMFTSGPGCLKGG